MNIGFVNVYPYRPHGHHAKFLEILSRQLGWKTFSLVCDAAVEHCYIRELKGKGRLECVKCITGGLASFSFNQADRISSYGSNKNLYGNNAEAAEKWVESSAYTLTRVESYAQRNTDLVNEKIQRLIPGTSEFYTSARQWITHRNLDAVIVFNGRMDLTRAVIQACEDSGITYLTHERPLFGNGIILNKNANCSALTNAHRINKYFSNTPLSKQQVFLAAELGLQRISTGNLYEWKRYNTDASNASDWPVSSCNLKVLVCPSSKNELLGHPDWETEWRDNTDALDAAVSQGLFDYSDLLVRFHPAWSVEFGQVSGSMCASHYRSWCEQRNVHFIESHETISTLSLIELADLVVVNGSTVAMEAGLFGKPIICLGPSSYTFAGIAVDILSLDTLSRINLQKILSENPADIVRKTLRFYYSRAFREPLFVDYVRSVSVTECQFFEGADPSLLQQVLFADEPPVGDAFIADSEEFENEVIKACFTSENYALEGSDQNHNLVPMKVTRKHVFRVIDQIRRLKPKGV